MKHGAEVKSKRCNGVKDAQIKLSREEYALSMGRRKRTQTMQQRRMH